MFDPVPRALEDLAAVQFLFFLPPEFLNARFQHGGSVFEHWSTPMKDLGYAIFHATISNSVWVASKRKTLVVIGFHADCGGSQAVAWYAKQLHGISGCQLPLPLWQRTDPDTGEVKGLLGPNDHEQLHDFALVGPFFY